MLSGSARGAAELLYVTQPVISKLIAQLESRTGLTLFERRGNAIVPTDDAKLLLSEAQSVFYGIERFDRFAANLRGGGKGRLSIFASPTLTSAVIPFILKSHLRHADPLEVLIASRLIRDIPSDLLADNQSVGVTIWQCDAPGISCEVLASKPLVLLVHPGSPLANRQRVHLNDVRSEHLIGHHESMPIGKKVREALHKLSADWPIRISVDSSEAAFSLVQNNLGVAFVDAFSKDYLQQRGLKTLEIDIDVFTHLCLLKSSFHRPTVHSDSFEQALREWVSTV